MQKLKCSYPYLKVIYAAEEVELFFLRTSHSTDSFGILESQALLYPNHDSWQFQIRRMIRRAYFHIYGELFLEEVANIPDVSEFEVRVRKIASAVSKYGHSGDTS